MATSSSLDHAIQIAMGKTFDYDRLAFYGASTVLGVRGHHHMATLAELKSTVHEAVNLLDKNDHEGALRWLYLEVSRIQAEAK